MQLADFLGHSANAVKWQVWTALLVNLLLRFLDWQSRWTHSFTRLFTFVRAALWLKVELLELLQRCGTADGDIRCIGQPARRGSRDPSSGLWDSMRDPPPSQPRLHPA